MRMIPENGVADLTCQRHGMPGTTSHHIITYKNINKIKYLQHNTILTSASRTRHFQAFRMHHATENPIALNQGHIVDNLLAAPPRYCAVRV
jgi:hypothetical protein